MVSRREVVPDVVDLEPTALREVPRDVVVERRISVTGVLELTHNGNP